MHVVFALDELRFALPLDAVQKVVRAVEVTPLPRAPEGVLGVVSIAGKIVPVFDVRARFGLVSRGARVTDHLAIVRTARQTLALLVDAPAEVTATLEARITPADRELSRTPSLSGVAQLAGGLVCIHDLERFLSAEDESALEAALTRASIQHAENPPSDAPLVPASAQ